MTQRLTDEAYSGIAQAKHLLFQDEAEHGRNNIWICRDIEINWDSLGFGVAHTGKVFSLQTCQANVLQASQCLSPVDLALKRKDIFLTFLAPAALSFH